MLQVFHYVNESLGNQLEKGHLKDMQEKKFSSISKHLEITTSIQTTIKYVYKRRFGKAVQIGDSKNKN